MKSRKLISLVIASIIVGTAAYGGRTPGVRIQERTSAIQEKDAVHAQVGEKAGSSCNSASAQTNKGSRGKNHGIRNNTGAHKDSDCMNMSDHEDHGSGDMKKHMDH